MSNRVVCLNYTPIPDAFFWADAVIHPGTSDQELLEIAKHTAWHWPTKVLLPEGEPIPDCWIRLQRLWHAEYFFWRYQVRDDARCTMPTHSWVLDVPVGGSVQAGERR